MKKEIKQHLMTVILSSAGFFLGKIVEDNISFKLDNHFWDNILQASLHILPYSIFWSGLVFIPFKIIMNKISNLESKIQSSIPLDTIKSTNTIDQDLEVIRSILMFWKREIRLKIHSGGNKIFYDTTVNGSPQQQWDSFDLLERKSITEKLRKKLKITDTEAEKIVNRTYELD